MQAMQLYNVSDVVPVNFIFFTVSAILAGNIFYQEFYGVPVLRVCMFLFGCCLSFIGVYIISQWLVFLVYFGMGYLYFYVAIFPLFI